MLYSAHYRLRIVVNLLPEHLEVLVLYHSGVRHLTVCVVHHSVSLVVRFVDDLCLKSHRTEIQMTELETEVFVYLPCVDQFPCHALLFLCRTFRRNVKRPLAILGSLAVHLQEVHACHGLHAIEKPLHQFVVSADGDALVGVVEVVVVVDQVLPATA